MAAIALFTLVSCSEDDATPTNPGENPVDAVLLKKTIETSLFGSFTRIYNYEGAKLLNVTYSTGGREEYTYDPDFDLIKTIKHYDENNIIVATYHFNYNLATGKLVEFSESFDEYTSVTEFTHNADGTVSYTTDDGQQYGVIYDNKFSLYTDLGPTTSMLWHNFELDDKKDPMMNVLGMDKLLGGDKPYLGYFGPKFGHNITDYHTTRADGAFNQQLQTSTYTYNNQGYPITEQRDDIGNVYSIEYFYE